MSGGVLVVTRDDALLHLVAGLVPGPLPPPVPCLRLADAAAHDEPLPVLVDAAAAGDLEAALRAFRHDDPAASRPLLVLGAAPADHAALLAAGADAVVPAPVTAAALRPALARALHADRLRRLVLREALAPVEPFDPVAVLVAAGRDGALAPDARARLLDVLALRASALPDDAGGPLTLVADGTARTILDHLAADGADLADACVVGVADRATLGTLPLGTLREAARVAADAARAEGVAARTWGAKAGDLPPDVVIVEDDPDLLRMLEFAVQSLGTTYRTFTNGAEALEALRTMPAIGQRILLLLDYNLPGMDGATVHEYLRRERPDDFVAVFCTLHATEAVQVRALTMGAVDFLPKPVNFRVLTAKLPIWLALTRRGG